MSMAMQSIVDVDTISSAMDTVTCTVSFNPDYVDILEKTNRQLSLWWNPFGVMVAALGALFAILAIFATIIIWRQGSEHRKILYNSISKYRQILDELVKEKIEFMEQRLNELIEVEKSKLATAETEQKKILEEKIKEMEEKRDHLREIDTSINTRNYVLANTNYNWGVDNAGVFTADMDTMHVCAKCGHKYDIQKKSSITIYFGSKNVTCPKCGNVERIEVWGQSL